VVYYIKIILLSKKSFLTKFYLLNSWDTNAGHHSAIHGKDKQDYLYIDFIVKHYESKGAPRSKLMLGLANYGRSDAPAMPYTGFKGILHS
jgi:hypothetical protein